MWGAWDRKHTAVILVGLVALYIVRFWWVIVLLGIAAYFACNHLTVTCH